MAMFETNKSPDMVRQLDRLLYSLRNIQYNDRKEQTRIWLEMLTMIDDNFDPNFDAMARGFSWTVIPPPDGRNGYQYPPGIDPKALKDPEARSNYEAAIHVNNQNIQKDALQVALYKLNTDASSNFEMFLKSSYTSSDTDKNEIREIICKLKSSPAHRQRMIQYCRVVLKNSTK